MWIKLSVMKMANSVIRKATIKDASLPMLYPFLPHLSFASENMASLNSSSEVAANTNPDTNKLMKAIETDVGVGNNAMLLTDRSMFVFFIE